MKIDPRTGARTPFGGAFETPGLATGLAFDAQGHLYVAEATLSDDPAPGVFRIDAKGAPKRVVTLPPDSFPNGLAFHDGTLYISDSALGAVGAGIPALHHQRLPGSRTTCCCRVAGLIRRTSVPTGSHSRGTIS